MAAKKSAAEDNYQIIASNRKARFEYTILEEVEAGIVLTGTEVKSLRIANCNLADAYADVRYDDKGNNEVWLLNLNINQYKNAATMNHKPDRPRKLLLHKKQIKSLIGKLQQKGFTLIPLVIYFNHKGLVKMKLAVCKGKTNEDKRQTIKTREWNRQKQRLMKDS